MGLLTTYSKSNRVVTNGKVLSYSKQYRPGQWSYNETISTIHTYYQMWECHRYCTKSYMYVGMDLTTAEACAAAAIAYYTRETKSSFWNYNSPSDGDFTTIQSGNVLMADVNIQQVEGHMYNVVINVREEDCRYTRNKDDDPATIFAFENLRKYDTGNGAFE